MTMIADDIEENCRRIARKVKVNRPDPSPATFIGREIALTLDHVDVIRERQRALEAWFMEKQLYIDTQILNLKTKPSLINNWLEQTRLTNEFVRMLDQIERHTHRTATEISSLLQQLQKRFSSCGICMSKYQPNMEIHRILRKLEPLMPRQVEHWSRSLLNAQPEVRTLLERQIRSTAHRLLGNLDKRTLLSLPSQDASRPSLRLGKIVYDTEKWDFGLELSELMQNLAVFGRSGAGKTNVAFQLIDQLVKKRICFLFLDWKRTARHLIPLFRRRVKVYTAGRELAPFPFNPFLIPPGCDSDNYVNQLVDVMADAYTLGDGATSVLHRAIRTCYAEGLSAPSIRQILKAFDAIPDNQRPAGWKISARRACESLELSKTVAMDSTSQHAFAKSLLRQNTIVELDGISQNTGKFLIPLLCHWIYSARLASSCSEELGFVIFLEEAHHVLYRHEGRAKETLMNVLLRQCRELGIGVVIIDQHPSLISNAGIGNCYTTICMNLKDPRDIHKASGLSGLEDDDKHCFNQLPVGQGVVKLQDRWRQAFLVQFPLVNAKKGVVTDEVLRGVQSGTISWAEFRERAGGEPVEGVRSRGRATSVEEGAVRLLHDVAQHPLDGVDARYKRLGVSAERGNRWKGQLIENGLVRSTKTKTNRTYRVVLRLTHEARLLMTPRPGHDPQASFAHEYWKGRVADQFERRGYAVKLEAPRQKAGGKMDISARRGSENVAIEIETSKSDVVSNVRRDLLCRVQRVIVVATDEAAIEKIERQLAEAGLIVPGRLDIVLQDTGWDWPD